MCNYRPITVRSIHSKIEEITLVPEVNISKSQYGFRKGRGAGMANALLNDAISYNCKFKDSPLFLASLDAEKCFDSVCHVHLSLILARPSVW